ncbi:MAG: biotin transporter BioY [candidate division KSB1 bacterium]|nr:biotin transporter BioY [candidate division KSB1 bacterium]
MRARSHTVIFVGLFAALTAIGAYIRIPLPYYVPLTLQTFFVLMAANLLGGRSGALSQLVYLLIGLAGIPVFAHGGGPGYVVQPTFGYLLGYPIAAYLSGRLVTNAIANEKRYIFTRVYLSNVLGIFLILGSGALYLFMNMRFLVGKSINFASVFWSGFIVFLPGELLKILLVTIIVMKLNRYRTTIE